MGSSVDEFVKAFLFCLVGVEVVDEGRNGDAVLNGSTIRPPR